MSTFRGSVQFGGGIKIDFSVTGLFSILKYSLTQHARNTVTSELRSDIESFQLTFVIRQGAERYASCSFAVIEGRDTACLLAGHILPQDPELHHHSAGCQDRVRKPDQLIQSTPAQTPSSVMCRKQGNNAVSIVNISFL